MTRSDPLVDQLADQMVSAAPQEIRSTLAEIHPNELTPLEMVALLTMLRPIRVRIEADGRLLHSSRCFDRNRHGTDIVPRLTATAARRPYPNHNPDRGRGRRTSGPSRSSRLAKNTATDTVATARMIAPAMTTTRVALMQKIYAAFLPPHTWNVYLRNVIKVAHPRRYRGR
jgi:hypothetical protein